MCLPEKHKQENLKGGLIYYFAINHGFGQSRGIVDLRDVMRVKSCLMSSP